MLGVDMTWMGHSGGEGRLLLDPCRCGCTSMYENLVVGLAVLG